VSIRIAFGVLALGFLTASTLTGCGDEDESTITVFAASSLTDAFTEVAAAFEAGHPGLHVRLSFASSAALAAQVQAGATPDLFASAEPALLEALHEDGSFGPPVPFASNMLVVAVASTDDSIRQIADLARPGLRLVLAAPGVPLGDYSREVLEGASAQLGPGFRGAVLANVRSEEANARATLAKIALGEADAGLVYATDLHSPGDGLRAVPVPPEYNITAAYVSSTAEGAGDLELAAQFQAFLASEAGQGILSSWGFGPPAAAPS